MIRFTNSVELKLRSIKFISSSCSTGLIVSVFRRQNMLGIVLSLLEFILVMKSWYFIYKRAFYLFFCLVS